MLLRFISTAVISHFVVFFVHLLCVNYLNIVSICTVYFVSSIFILLSLEETPGGLVSCTMSSHPLRRIPVPPRFWFFPEILSTLICCLFVFHQAEIASCQRPLQRDEGAVWTRDFSILITVHQNTRPRWRHMLRSVAITSVQKHLPRTITSSNHFVSFLLIASQCNVRLPLNS